ncbi:hypothetical protein PGT21_018789 [Puccinia graminis f. sp. tritici]|uniref:Uncharacterized protein n=1 Tax=Puccinia graminis f. sp. tritici TaxID=56615 RepID=A0A5B0Q3G8_PUCGR|nr:hypothetical protein PGT21_018789 [Puccinia graminis f. sp. tritici]
MSLMGTQYRLEVISYSPYGLVRPYSPPANNTAYGTSGWQRGLSGGKFAPMDNPYTTDDPQQSQGLHYQSHDSNSFEPLYNRLTQKNATNSQRLWNHPGLEEQIIPPNRLRGGNIQRKLDDIRSALYQYLTWAW